MALLLFKQLKGDTPDYDRVLFTLVNGQVLPTGNSKPTSGDTGVTSTPPSQARFQQQAPTSVPAAVPPPLSRKKQKKQEKKKQKKLLKAANEAVQSASAQLPSTHSVDDGLELYVLVSFYSSFENAGMI